MFVKCRALLDSMKAGGLLVALISLVLLSALAYFVFLRSSSVFIPEPFTQVTEKCTFPDTLRCYDYAVYDDSIGIVLSNRGSRYMIIRNVSVASGALEGGFCTTENVDARLRAHENLGFTLTESQPTAYSGDAESAYAAFYAGYGASAAFAHSSAVNAARDHAGSVVVAAVLAAADADGATANSVVEGAAVAAEFVISSANIFPADYAEDAKRVAREVSDAVSEAAGMDGATAASVAETVFVDVGRSVRYPGFGLAYLYPSYGSSRTVPSVAGVAYSVADRAAGSAVSSVVKAADAASVADGATASSVAGAARAAANSHASDARAAANSDFAEAARAASAAAASYAAYDSGYYNEFASFNDYYLDSVRNFSNNDVALQTALSFESPGARFSYFISAVTDTIRFAISTAAYDALASVDDDYARLYYRGSHHAAYTAIGDVANGSVAEDDSSGRYSGYTPYDAAYSAAVGVISADPSAYDAAYSAAVDAYFEVYSILGFDARHPEYVGYYDAAYSVAYDVIAAAYAAYSGSDEDDSAAHVAAFAAAFDAASGVDYAAAYPDDPAYAATAAFAAAYAVYWTSDIAEEYYPDASIADYAAYADYAGDAAASAYAYVYALDAAAAAAAADYVAAAVAAASDGGSAADSPEAAAAAVIAAAKTAAADAAAVAESAAKAVADKKSNGNCAYVEPDIVEAVSYWGDPISAYSVEIIYSWADEPGANHRITGEMRGSSPYSPQ